MVTANRTSCLLCGLATFHPLVGDDGGDYCCPACVEVAQLIRISGSPAENISKEAIIPDSTEVTLALNGLWCSSCAWLIQERLGRAEGVLKADVSFLRREARLQFVPEKTNPGRLKRAVRLLGYGARLPDEEPYDEEDTFFTRLLIGGVLAMHVMLFSFMIYFRQWLGIDTPDSQWLVEIFHLMIFAASVPIMIILGLPILRAGLAGLIRGRPTTHTLVAIGAFAAFIVSLRNLLAGDGRVYFDTAAMLFFLIAIGRWLEIRAHKTSSEAVEKLAEQIPQIARWMGPDGERTVPIDELPVGARVLVLPGERFPVDGIVADGTGEVDESLLTGEPTPNPRHPGETVLAGTINLDSAFEVITSAVGESSTAGQITRLLHQALWQRSPAERQADRVAAWMIPLAIVLAGITYLYWAITQNAETGLMNSLSVLLIACPCALGLATPLTLWHALGRAARAGVIARSTAVIERLGSIQRVYFDKTGTLTQLPMQLEKIGLTNGEVAEIRFESHGWANADRLLQDFIIRTASLEALSEHPFAASLKQWAETAPFELIPVKDFRAVAGAGVEGTIDGLPTWVGSARLMATSHLKIPDKLTQLTKEWQRRGMAVIYAGWEGQVQGILGFAEAVKPEAEQAIAELISMGIKTAVLTGDNQAAGQRWSEMLGIPVEGGLLPEEKLARLKRNGDTVAMVGDGINDGPALAAAPVGIAINQGSDVAQAAAEVVLMRDNLRTVPWLLGLGRETLRKIRQNLAWAFFYNILGIALAMTGHLQPVLAALAMVLSSLIVTTNALRLSRFPGLDGEPDLLSDDLDEPIYPYALEEPV